MPRMAKKTESKDLRTQDLFEPAFIEEMAAKLREMKTELEKKLGIFKSDTEEQHGTFPDYGDEEDDNVHEIEGFLVNESLKAEYEKELRDVESALRRIDEGTYGICKYTGKKIDEKRLRIRPTSSSSVEAKEALQPKRKE